MRRALSVGINEFLYHPASNLRGCRNDALNMRAFFGVELGIAEADSYYLLDKNATAQNVMDILTGLVASTEAGDYLAISFSSHGTQIPDTDGDELDNWHEALVCHDIRADGDNWSGGYILDKDLRDLLKQVDPEARVECWIDTCYAGGIRALASLGMTYGRARMLLPPGQQRPLEKHLGLDPPDNAVIWQACKEEQTSADTYIAGQWCGAFTHAFLHSYYPGVSRYNTLLKTKQFLSTQDYNQVPQLVCGDDEMKDSEIGE